MARYQISESYKMLFYLLILVILFILFIIIYMCNHYELYRYWRLKSATNIEMWDKRYSNLPRVNSKKNIVVSLTTIPPRIQNLRPTLISILNSSVRVDEIQINIPYKTLKGKTYSIPKWLSSLEHIKIYRCKKDFGPATKLLPTLKRENGIIIVVDDDVIYGSKMIEMMTKEYYKRKCAITTFGALVRRLSIVDEKIPTYLRFKNPRRVDMVMGHNGFLVTRKMFGPEVFDYKGVPIECMMVDDVWFSGWLMDNRIKIWSLGSVAGTIPITNIETIDRSASLCSSKNFPHNNNTAIEWFYNSGIYFDVNYWN